MYKEFETYIVELLKHHDCVSIPSFGAFILKNKAASIHQQAIFPQGKTLAFNQSIKLDDELLTGAVMHAENLDYTTAKNKSLAFANQLAYTLKKDAYVSMPAIGSFTQLQNGSILFTPLMVQVFSKPSFGLQPLAIQPVIRNQKEEGKKETTAQKKTSTLAKDRKSKTRSKAKPLVGLIFSVLAMLALGVLIFTDTQITPIKYQRAGFIDMFFPNDTHVVSFQNLREDADVSRNGIYPREGADYGSVFAVSSNDFAKGYYIVLGSYISEENAQRYEATLFEKGLDTYIIPSEQGMFRVCAFADRNFLPSKEKLESITVKGAWLLKNV